jgi:hypothetical protein
MIKYAAKIILCALVTVVGTVLGGVVSVALQMARPQLPVQENAGISVLYTLAGGVVLCVALAELSRRIRGDRWTRFALITWLAYAWLGINNTIEASIFTTIGGGASVIVIMLFPCLSVSGAIVFLFDNSGIATAGSPHRFFANQSARQWPVRFLMAIVAFPVIYFVFGMPVGLIVGKLYQNQQFGLRMPSLTVVVAVRFLHSIIALLAALPILAVWSRSRRQFAWTFGLSLFVLSGLYGLIQAYWMPWTMRSVHCAELFLESLSYGWLLALLLLPHPAQSSTPKDVGDPTEKFKLVS